MRSQKVRGWRFGIQGLAIVIAMGLIASGAKAQQSTGTSTLAAPVKKDPLGRFGLGYTADTSFGPADNLVPVVTNIAAVKYKLSDTDKIILKQYWDTGFGDKNTTDNNKVSWLVAQYSTKTKGILGSDDIAPLFWYYIPTAANSSLENGRRDERITTNGALRLDAEVIWTLTPKWQVSYYFNPRQSLVPGKQALYSLDEKKNVYDFASATEAKTTLLHYGLVYYNVNDKIQPYGGLGFKHDFLTNDGFANISNKAYPVMGCSFTVSKNLLIQTEINQVDGVALTSTKYSQSESGEISRNTTSESTGWLDSQNFNYNLILALSI